jgi:hypothetical protein
MIKNKIAENATLKSPESRKITGKVEIVGGSGNPKVAAEWAGAT